MQYMILCSQFSLLFWNKQITIQNQHKSCTSSHSVYAVIQLCSVTVVEVVFPQHYIRPVILTLVVPAATYIHSYTQYNVCKIEHCITLL